MKKNFVSFIDKKTKKEYFRAKEENPTLFKFLERATDDLKKDPEIGTKIPKKYWPEYYVKRHKIDNLWKYDLPNAWRLIYTIVKAEVKIISVILEWFDHKNYERRFGYG
jgi:hypothetical protein